MLTFTLSLSLCNVGRNWNKHSWELESAAGLKYIKCLSSFDPWINALLFQILRVAPSCNKIYLLKVIKESTVLFENSLYPSKTIGTEVSTIAIPLFTALLSNVLFINLAWLSKANSMFKPMFSNNVQLIKFNIIGSCNWNLQYWLHVCKCCRGYRYQYWCNIYCLNNVKAQPRCICCI